MVRLREEVYKYGKEEKDSMISKEKLLNIIRSSIVNFLTVYRDLDHNLRISIIVLFPFLDPLTWREGTQHKQINRIRWILRQVKDTIEVDYNVSRHLTNELRNADWDLLVNTSLAISMYNSINSCPMCIFFFKKSRE